MTITPQPSLRVHEIYQSIQGESTQAGRPCTFIRLAGCPLRCRYCDTPQAIPSRSGQPMDIADIVSQVSQYATPLLLVTGGEPLAQKNCILLLEQLLPHFECVQLETSGAFPIQSVPAGVHRIVDIKTPCSGESGRNRWENLQHLRLGDELKMVISNREDYDWIKQVMQKHQLADSPAALLFSPAWQKMDPAELVAWILEDQLPVRIQLQLHKYIWGAEAKGV